MAAVLRHCLLIVGPTEDKTEELHRWVAAVLISMKEAAGLVLMFLILIVYYKSRK